MKKYQIRNMVVAAMLIALCVVLPIAFHSIPDGGSIFLPMHIPVLICGMLCGWPYGFICGLLGPLLSSIITGMPPAAYLPPMMVECAVYGLTSGLMLRFVRTGKLFGDLYIALTAAMLAGRIVSGIAKALIFAPGMSLAVWVTGSFVTALPGIVIQLALIPYLVQLLMKTKFLPQRYPKEAQN